MKKCKYCDFNNDIHEKGCPLSFEEHLLNIVLIFYNYVYVLVIRGRSSELPDIRCCYEEIKKLAIKNARKEIKRIQIGKLA